MKAGDFIEGELVKLIITSGEHKDKEILGYVNEINKSVSKLCIFFIKSEHPFIQPKSIKWLYPYNNIYKLIPIRDTSPEVLYDMMDFALTIKDFDYAAEIYERLYG